MYKTNGFLQINLAKLNYGQPKPSSFLRFPVRFPVFNSQDSSGQGFGDKEDLFGHCTYSVIYKVNTSKI